MKFLIQKINGEVRHDFAFTLLESIDYNNWCQNNIKIGIKYINYDNDNQASIQFKSFHKNYVPVGSVEFINKYLNHFYGMTVRPINVPEELIDKNFTHRLVFNGTEAYFPHIDDKMFIKSNDRIKSICGIYNQQDAINLPVGNYQFSEVIKIKSEWRAFFYQGALVGLQNYAGDFILFPDVNKIWEMAAAYKSAPIAYTLDVGVNDSGTFVIECHDFFACGLYGFANHSLYPKMLHKWFWQYIQREIIK